MNNDAKVMAIAETIRDITLHIGKLELAESVPLAVIKLQAARTMLARQLARETESTNE